jgi:GH18 family chitinase
VEYVFSSLNSSIFFKVYDLVKLKQSVNFWMLSHFHHEGSWSPTTAITSPLKRLVTIEYILYCTLLTQIIMQKEDGIKAYGKYIPSGKIVIGIPAFNQPVQVADTSKTGIGSPLHKKDRSSKLFKDFKNVRIVISKKNLRRMSPNVKIHHSHYKNLLM